MVHLTSVMKNRSCQLLLALAATLSAQAHPGHSIGEHGISHALASPYHVATLLLLGGAAWLGAMFVQRSLPRRLLQGFGTASAICGILLLAAR